MVWGDVLDLYAIRPVVAPTWLVVNDDAWRGTQRGIYGADFYIRYPISYNEFNLIGSGILGAIYRNLVT